MSLASHLLKHFVIAKYCIVPWSKSKVSRDAKGKPCFSPGGSEKNDVKIDFNISHQAGIVTLIASVGFPSKVDVGTDVVCANERILQDRAHINKEGFFAWVDMHADVFAESEVQYMKLSPVKFDLESSSAIFDGYGKDAISRCQWRTGEIYLKVLDEDGAEHAKQVSSAVVVDAKLRRFYAMWCLREAYVKMTGEALLAPWLKQLEISDVDAPAAKDGILDPHSLEEGDIVRDFRICFKNKPVTDVKMELSALGAHFMIAGSVRGDNAHAIQLGRWRHLDLEEILAFT